MQKGLPSHKTLTTNPKPCNRCTRAKRENNANKREECESKRNNMKLDLEKTERKTTGRTKKPGNAKRSSEPTKP
jgi:hypothetical protein